MATSLYITSNVSLLMKPVYYPHKVLFQSGSSLSVYERLEAASRCYPGLWNKSCLSLRRGPRSCHTMGFAIESVLRAYDWCQWPFILAFARGQSPTAAYAFKYGHQHKPVPEIETAARTVTLLPRSNAEDASYYSISIHIIRFERCSRPTRIPPLIIR